MRHYEVMVILDAALEEDAIRAIVDRATKSLTSGGATVGKVDRWGKRRFAYEVNHKGEGYYLLINFEAEPAAVFELDRMLGLADEVIRHKVIRLPEKVTVGAASGAAKPPGATSTDSAGGTPSEANENGAN
jgi:small subunit ribosomal protein S6